MTTCTLPVGRNRTVADSQPPAPKFSDARTRDGARPHISTYDEMPMPRCFVAPVDRRSAWSLRNAVVADELERPIERGS